MPIKKWDCEIQDICVVEGSAALNTEEILCPGLEMCPLEEAGCLAVSIPYWNCVLCDSDKSDCINTNGFCV